MTHRPQRFEVYTQLEDGSGFKLPNNQHVFVFDRYGGWFDEQHNYYNADGDAETPPSSQHSYDDHDHKNRKDSYSDDDFYEDIVNQYKYDNDSEEEDHQYNAQDLRNMQKIAHNQQILSSYPFQKALRVYYKNMDFYLQPDKIIAAYQKHVAMTAVVPVNQNGKRNGEGYFVLPNKQQAKKLIELQGKNVAGRAVYFTVQPIQQLIFDPLDKQWTSSSGSNNIWKADVTKKIQKQIQKPKQVQQIKQIQPVVSTKTEQSNKQQIMYSFQLPLFESADDFKSWMKSMSLQFNTHYNTLKKKSKQPSKQVYGTIIMPQSSFKICNGQKYKTHIIQFTKVT